MPGLDDPDWFDEAELEASGIGPLMGQVVRMAGLTGGALPTTTRDGWALERLTVAWPHESVLLTAPGSWIFEDRAGRSSEFVKIAEESELRACGFSPTGRSLVVATSSDVTMYSRSPE